MESDKKTTVELTINDKGYAFFNEWQEEIINQEIIAQNNLNKKNLIKHYLLFVNNDI